MSRVPFVYFAHPIDFVSVRREQVEQVCRTIQHAELAAYVPGWAFKTPLGASAGPEIAAINRAALAECAGLVAWLPPEGSTSLGVPMEIADALTQGKPMVIVGVQTMLEQSWALPRPGELVRHSTAFGDRDAAWLRGAVTKRPTVRRHEPIFAKVENGAKLPTRSYSGDAGFDLYTLGDHLLEPGENYDIACGISVQLPPTVWAMITGRSSTIRKHGLLVATGIIDSGYRGPLYANVQNLGPEVVEVKHGQRLAQLIPFPLTAAGLHPVAVDVLAPSDRGTAGFGSSGA